MLLIPLFIKSLLNKTGIYNLSFGTNFCSLSNIVASQSFHLFVNNAAFYTAFAIASFIGSIKQP